GLLRDAEARGLRLGSELVRSVLGVEVGGEAGDAALPVEVRAQRRLEAQVVELRGAQAERELAYTLERVLHRLDAFGDARAQRRVAGELQRLELDLERGERLADVVVQVAREAPTLLLLHFQQPARERAQPLVRQLELAVHALE